MVVVDRLPRSMMLHFSFVLSVSLRAIVPSAVITIEIGTRLLFFMLLKNALLCNLYLLTYIICAIETSCDENLFLPFASIHFFNSRCYLKGGYAIERI